MNKLKLFFCDSKVIAVGITSWLLGMTWMYQTDFAAFFRVLSFLILSVAIAALYCVIKYGVDVLQGKYK